MSRRRLSARVRARAAAARSAGTSPTGPDNICGGGVMTGSGTCMVNQ